MNETSPLAARLARLSWSPEQLAREINKRHGAGTISSKAPYNWLKGACPRRQLPHEVAALLTARLGEPVTVEELWPRHFPPASGTHERRARRHGHEIPAVVVEMLATRVCRLRELREDAQHGLARDWAVQDLGLARRLAAEYTCDPATGARLHRIIDELSRLAGQPGADLAFDG